MDCQDVTTTVWQNQQLAGGYGRMQILVPDDWPEVAPGQFVMVADAGSADPLLRRPFGIFALGAAPPLCSGQPALPYIELLYRVVGRGTSRMAAWPAGHQVTLLGPLGRGFDGAAAGPKPLLVAGGLGIVPLYLLARQLAATTPVHLLLGGRSREDILAVTEFERLGVETYVATDDGSLGEQGLVTEVLERQLQQRAVSHIYACGPPAMLNQVQQLAHSYGVALEVSLEAHMACGVGACLGCVVPVTTSCHSSGYACCCTQGPVFKAQELDWQRVQGGFHGCGD